MLDSIRHHEVNYDIIYNLIWVCSTICNATWIDRPLILAMVDLDKLR